MGLGVKDAWGRQDCQPETCQGGSTGQDIGISRECKVRQASAGRCGRIWQGTNEWKIISTKNFYSKALQLAGEIEDWLLEVLYLIKNLPLSF